MNCFVPVFTRITSTTTMSFFLYILSENVWEKPNIHNFLQINMSSNRPQRKITNSFQGFKSLPLHTFPLDIDLNIQGLFFSIGERKQK